ncbi:alkylation response protein AidB-like acyl-CoA dehydrogenase [Nocardia transvalensis]|uniref:Alkylation response protein AidB-like acyl-CoA dehydrogenase n=1 Tax=Nocardia transvalensis TaxID=37333 RepID=A0A7W9UH07_9NOCA|nr:acyl-CoA dehydrogenase family protein [Nocardia transvalensis]MBB5912210.1 alkylation response protein AidB-like acyl-CoA dehydrogenase [Nocardia transvalensis]
MRSLEQAREVCERHVPGLYPALASIPLSDLEAPGNSGLELFRKFGGPALVIPAEYAGRGVSPVEALQVTRAIGACAPSLSVATTMHHFSVATIFALATSLRASGVEWALLEGISEQNLLVASGFAEGDPGAGILTPTLRGVVRDGGIVVNGAKKPCSMSASMDLLSASVSVATPDGDATSVVLVPASTPGLSVHPFWASIVLTGAESDEVRLTDVVIDERLVVPAGAGDRGELDDLQTTGFIWFEMLITACYLGMASALVERVFSGPRSSVEQRAELGIRLETAALLLEGIAQAIATGRTGNDDLARALVARYGAVDAIRDVVVRATEALGGMAFITDPDVAYLAAACQCAAFHPPSRSATSAALAANLSGDVLRIE